MFLETEKLLDEKAILVFLFLVNYTQHSCCLLFVFVKRKKIYIYYIYICMHFCVNLSFFFSCGKEHLKMSTQHTSRSKTQFTHQVQFEMSTQLSFYLAGRRRFKSRDGIKTQSTCLATHKSSTSLSFLSVHGVAAYAYRRAACYTPPIISNNTQHLPAPCSLGENKAMPQI